MWNLTMMFLQMWEVISYNEKPADYELYRPCRHCEQDFESDGYVLPYGDSPLDHEDVGELTYLNILHNAKDYCYITTPYLILSEDFLAALCFAAKKGIDVRIIVPGIPDKWYVKAMGVSYYDELIEAGVRIYEYDGFIHAKMFVSDDEKAVVGTINLDYRSLYLHFENGCFMYKTAAVKSVRDDILYMTENKCKDVTAEDCKNSPRGKRMVSALLKLLEPLL